MLHERNRHWIYGKYLLIECNSKKKKQSWFITDKKYIHLIERHKWYISNQGYPSTRINNTIRRFHQLVMNGNDTVIIDHINQDKQDNRRCNLRLVDKRENIINSKLKVDNTSGCKGVSWHQKSQKWRAYINTEKGSIHLGLFELFEQAMLARYEAEQQYFN